jgi:CTP:molybdopterin cytidylyltransferase MocA
MSPPPRPCGLILAAGRGRRMGGRDKAMLAIGGHTLIEEHVASFRRAGINDIAVVRRTDAAELPASVGNVRVVLQPQDDATMFDSLVLGLFALDRAPVLVLPVDNDLLGEDTVDLLVAEAMDETATHAVVPRYGDRHGHPVVLFREGVDAIVRDAAAHRGAHRLDKLLDEWSGGVRPLDVTDDAVTRDFDTLEDLAGRL